MCRDSPAFQRASKQNFLNYVWLADSGKKAGQGMEAVRNQFCKDCLGRGFVESLKNYHKLPILCTLFRTNLMLDRRPHLFLIKSAEGKTQINLNIVRKNSV